MPTTPHGRLLSMVGWIGASGFASGHRLVVGHWRRSPVGPITDVMWAAPDGTRTLLAPDARAAAFITAVYVFDAVEVLPLTGGVDRAGLHVRSPRLDLDLLRGPRVPLPGSALPAVAWRLVAAPVARRLLGVHVHGRSPTGVEEWYRARSWAPLRAAGGTLDGDDLGGMADVDPPLGVGFSEPPARPSLVGVDPLLRDHDGRIAAALRATSS